MSRPGFWDSAEAAQKVVAELKTLKAVVTPVREFERKLDDLTVLFGLAAEEDSAEDLSDAAAQAEQLQ